MWIVSRSSHPCENTNRFYISPVYARGGFWTTGSVLHSASTGAPTIIQRQGLLVERRLVVLHHVELVVLDQVVQERAEGIQGEADHVVVVAFDAPHQQRAAALCTPAKGGGKHVVSVILPTLAGVGEDRGLT